MLTPTRLEEERAELDAVLHSEVLGRSPSLSRFLSYVCERYFEGDAAHIKEYNIAVEALGRPPEFDQKKDSIVRVEAHRLRKRLKQFYASEGSHRTLEIVIPPGQYVPHFVARTGASTGTDSLAERADALLATGDDPVELPVPLPRPVPALSPGMPAEWAQRPSLHQSRIWVYFALLAALGGSGWLGYARLRPLWGASVAARAEVSPDLLPGTDERHIRAGMPWGPYIDKAGQTWEQDRYFTGGQPVALPKSAIRATFDADLFDHRREGEIRYDIPLQPGYYELHLYFAEQAVGNAEEPVENSRVFDVQVNGEVVLAGVDVYSDVGANVADVRVIKSVRPAPDGKLHLQLLQRGERSPFLNAIEIVPGLPGKMIPVRMIVRDMPYRDPQGQVWKPDYVHLGGTSVYRPHAVTGAPDPELFRGERWGHLRYQIPVAPGRYRLTMYFAEQWFGPDRPGGGAAGSRLFDVFCNGVALLRKLDVLDEAGSRRALIKTFHGLEPNAQGRLDVNMVPSSNYAMINAIEVVDESR